MNRQQMIETAARVMCDKPQDSLPRWDSCDSDLRRIYIDEAAAVLDAILPQVTSVEELEAVTPRYRTKLVNSAGGVHSAAYWLDLIISNGINSFPLTIVWQP